MRQYDRAVLRLAVHLTGSQEDGQDIYQEAFLRAYINIGSFRFECSFYTWIYRIVTNLCLDHLRKRSPWPGSDYDDFSRTARRKQVLDRVPDQRPGASPERSLAGRELRAYIVRALQPALAAGASGVRTEALPRHAAAHRRRNAEHDRRHDQEHAVPRHPQTADPTGDGSVNRPTSEVY